MKSSLYILFFAFVIVGCSDTQKDTKEIFVGTYYCNTRTSQDTLKFQSNEPKGILRGFNSLIWTITKDSIYQEDCHGLYRCTGKDKCVYSIHNDTLILKYIEINPRTGLIVNNTKLKEIKYIILSSNKKNIQLIPTVKNTDQRIRSDIQLK